jgi:hypothetical protein
MERCPAGPIMMQKGEYPEKGIFYTSHAPLPFLTIII